MCFPSVPINSIYFLCIWGKVCDNVTFKWLQIKWCICFLLSLDNLMQTSWPSLDPRRPVWALIASIFLPFLRGMLAAYTCLVSSRPAEWGRLLQMLTRHLQSLTLDVPCNLGAVTGWGGVRVRHCVMAGTPGPLLMIGRQGIPSDWWAVLMEPVPWS